MLEIEATLDSTQHHQFTAAVIIKALIYVSTFHNSFLSIFK